MLVNISSGAATTVYVGWAPYCASKAAVDMFTAVVAQRGARRRARRRTRFLLAPSTPTCSPDPGNPGQGRAGELTGSAASYAEGRFNSPEWVAEFILEHCRPHGGGAEGKPAGAPSRSSSVRLRVPDEYGLAKRRRTSGLSALPREPRPDLRAGHRPR